MENKLTGTNRDFVETFALARQKAPDFKTKMHYSGVIYGYLACLEDNGKITYKDMTELYNFYTSDNLKIEYKYGMRLRGFSPGCQPKGNLVERQDDPTGKYYDILVYSEWLDTKTTEAYDLDYLGRECKLNA